MPALNLFCHEIYGLSLDKDYELSHKLLLTMYCFAYTKGHKSLESKNLCCCGMNDKLHGGLFDFSRPLIIHPSTQAQPRSLRHVLRATMYAAYGTSLAFAAPYSGIQVGFYLHRGYQGYS